MDIVNTIEIVSDANPVDPTGLQHTSDKLDSEISQSIAPMETEKCEKRRQWSELPSLPLEMIYSFLRRLDQVNMSQVCRAWSAGYNSPSVWKTFRYTLKNSELSMDTCPVMKSVQKYNSMFRHVKVYIEFSLKKSLVKNWCRHFIAFLKILTDNSQLFSVEFYNVSFCLRLVDKQTYDDICLAIANFLGSQHYLKRVEFHRSYFEFHEGIELLRKIIDNSRKSLEHLVLRGFVRYVPINQEQDSIIFAQNLPTIADLPNLTTLHTDYSLIFENMVARLYAPLQTVKRCHTPKLSKIILNCQTVMMQIGNLRGLTSADWRFLKVLFPHLEVELIIRTHVTSQQELKSFIVPNMPITRLEYRRDGSDMGVETDVLFDVLLAYKTNEQLVSLCIQWDCPVPDLVSPFIPFLSACKKLKCLELFIFYPNNIADLMEYWLDNPPEYLENVDIYIPHFLQGDYLINLTFKYVPLLELRGLKVKFNGYTELIN